MRIKIPKRLLFIFIIFLLIVVAGFIPRLAAQTQTGQKEKKEFPPAENYTVKKAVSKIKIDGVLNEEAWKYPGKIATFYEWMPGDNIPAPVETEVLVTFDKSRFYVAFKCFDPEPQKIRAHLMDRDSIDTFVQDDYVSFMIDTFNDERRAFQFRVNPLGVQADANFSELEGYEDFSWDAIWEAAGKITDFGYVVEIAIPFNQLRFPKDKGIQTWGFEADRNYPRSVRHRVSSHVRDRNKSGLLCQFNKLSGFDNISPGSNIELDPTLTLNRTDKRDNFPAGAMEKGKINVEPGLTARWGITSNLILNATLNPDFSQVEADVAQLEINKRFALRYPEKRPFFLEGADFFLTPLEAVFTRTVYDPLWGAKMSGKLGKNVIGFFATQDRYNTLVFPANQGSAQASLEDDVFGGVFRYRRDVGKGSTMGFLYTGRIGDDYYNHVTGVDGFFRLSGTKTFNIQYLHSETDYPGTVARSFGQAEDSFGGDALYAWFVHRSRNWYYYAGYEDLAADFRADSGFIPRVDTRKIEAVIHPIFWGKEGAWFDRIGVMARGRNITDHDNNLTDRELLLAASYQGPLQSYVEVDYMLQKELYNGILFDKNLLALYIIVKPAGGLNSAFYMEVGDAIDYSNVRLAKSLLLNPAVEFGIGRHFNIIVNHLFQRLSLGGDRIYTANLLQTKMIYNLNVRTFIRAIIQYTDIDRNVALYLDPVEPRTRALIDRNADLSLYPVEPRTKALFTQFLFSYKINPQTVLFIGYSDNHLGFRGIDITRTDRTFFLKIGYALVI